MSFTKENFVGNLYQTSIPKEGNKTKESLLNIREENIEVYDFDEVKKWFCEQYRNKKELRSCDAYYEDRNKNFWVIEFKNAHHLKIKSYVNSVVEKAVDTHMLLLETFLREKQIEI